MRVLVTGVKGQLGFDCVKLLNERNIENIGADREAFDITNYEETKLFIENYQPNVIIHCAAYTAVDKAEDDSEMCYNVNVNGTKNILEIAKKINAKLVYISTDYVFDGEKLGSYLESDTINPISVYGKTKADGEKLVLQYDKAFVVRISWVFGVNGNNFIKTMLNLSKTRDELNVVSDQIGSPTYTKDLSYFLLDLIKTEKYGIYHATNEGDTNWFEFACQIFKESNIEMKVNPITTSQYPTKATRPKNSTMSKNKLIESGFTPLRNWKVALKEFLEEIK